jgi:hypothetical protein
MEKSPFIKKQKRWAIPLVAGLLILSGCALAEKSSIVASSDGSSSQADSSTPITSSIPPVSSSPVSLSSFTVDFVNYDGAELYTTTVVQGETAFYKGEVPTRPQNESTTYSFIGWNKSLGNIQSNTTFIAQYTAKVRAYQARFLNYDDSLLDVESVFYGDTAVYTGDKPEKPSTDKATYRWNGWDKSLRNITSDTTFTAVFTENINNYTVIFKNYDGLTLYETTVAYGETAVFSGSTPIRPAEGRNQYAFDGWDGLLTDITQNTVLTARFKSSARDVTTGLVYSYDATNKLYSVTGYTGSDKDVYVGKIFDDGTNGVHPVGSIGGNAFSNNPSASITSVFLEDNITVLNDRAFQSCYQLTKIRLSENLTKIGYACFDNCNRLTSLEVPATVSAIDRGAFNGTPQNFALTIDEENPYFVYEDYLLKSKDRTIVYQSVRLSTPNLVIPEGTTTIVDSAFWNLGTITSISFPSSLKEIGEEAFYACYNLKTVIFNNCPAKIGSSAFANDSSLASVDFGNSLISIGDRAFSNCSVLQTVSLPATVNSIVSNAFNSCAKLENINLDSANASFTSVNGVLFDKAKTMIVIFPPQKTGVLTLPSTFASYNSDMNNGGNQLGRIEVETGNPNFSAQDGVLYDAAKTSVVLAPGKILSITLPDTVTQINARAFYLCSLLSSVTFDSNLTRIYEDAFNGCVALKNVVFPSKLVGLSYDCFESSGLQSVSIPGTLTSIDWGTFSDCQSLTTVTLEEGLTYFGSGTFSNCRKLTTVNFASTLTSISSSCFSNCGLSEVTIPDSVTSIGNNAFSSNAALKKVTFGSSVTQIYYYAFSSCSLLSEVNLDSKLTTIDERAFTDCYALKSLILPASVTTLSNNTFNGCSNLATLYLEAKTAPNNLVPPANCKTYLYSDTANYDGKHWSYVNGVPTVWVKTS